MPFLFLFFLFFSCIHAATIPDKVLICGICKNIEKSFANSALSASLLGEQFLDYRIIIYENNSTDSTKTLLKAWASYNPRVIAVSENLSSSILANHFAMKIFNRTEMMAYARNRVLDIAMQNVYSDYKYIIWADLDFLEPWDITNIVDTILHPQQAWDAVLANGSYDLFAFRDPEFPIGCELLGNRYWLVINEIRSRFHLNPDAGWRKVYSAFGGLGIYKREALKGCRYSGVVTQETEDYVLSWLTHPSFSKNTCLAKQYNYLVNTAPIVQLSEPLLLQRNLLSPEIGVRLFNNYGKGILTWFSCTPNTTLPYICEHIPLYAAMAARGHDKIFVNPQLISKHP